MKEQDFDNQHLVTLLKSVDRPGDYCVGGRLDVPMPRVTVSGVGSLSFPVPQAQIDALVSIAKRAPYGKGTKTLTDTSVRDCWQIDAKKIRISGRSWDATFQKILDLVRTGIGLSSGQLDAKLYKLLIYRKDGFFAAHRDTEKVRGMIATLSVSLPTPGEGGEISIRHGDEETVFNLNAQEPSELAYAAFYADCLHEVRPVTEGHRISLIFNLFIRSGKKWTGAPDYTELTKKVTSHLSDWKEHGKTEKVAWLLDHSYSKEGLSFNTLKGIDASVAKILGEAADSTGCVVNAAVLHIYEMGDPFVDVDEYARNAEVTTEMEVLVEREEHLENWVARDGSHPPFGELELADGELIPPDRLENADADEKLLEDYHGNYGPTLELIYRLAALVVWPKAKTLDIVASGSIKHAVSWVTTQIHLISDADMTHLLSRLVDLWPETCVTYEEYNRDGMLRLLRETRNSQTAENFLERTVLNHYNGSENTELLDLIPILGPEAADRFLPSLIANRILQHPKEMYSLLTLITESLREEDPAWREMNIEWGRSALSNLFSVLEECSKNLAAVETYNPRKGTTEYENPEIENQYSLNQETIHDIFALAWLLNLTQESVHAAVTISDFSKLVTPDRMLPKALKSLSEIEGFDSTETYRLLWQQSVDFLLWRSGVPPEEAIDWTIDGVTSDTGELGVQLHEFCLNPKRKLKRFHGDESQIAKLREIIKDSRLKIRHVTERKRGTYALVCTKIRLSPKQRQMQYSEDIRYMGLLKTLVPRTTNEDAELERIQLLNVAQERFEMTNS